MWVLRGAVLGTIAFVLLKELLSTHAIVGNAADHWQLTLGIAIIALVALLPKGLVGINDKWQKEGSSAEVSVDKRRPARSRSWLMRTMLPRCRCAA